MHRACYLHGKFNQSAFDEILIKDTNYYFLLMIKGINTLICPKILKIGYAIDIHQDTKQPSPIKRLTNYLLVDKMCS